MSDPAKDLTLTPEPSPPTAPMPWLEEIPPRQIVAELDRYIVGQEAAKKAVAIAVRNRWRRAQAPDDIRDEITPYNIIMIGPTGVGKTEVARRLARLSADAALLISRGSLGPAVRAGRRSTTGHRRGRHWCRRDRVPSLGVEVPRRGQGRVRHR